MNYFLYKDTKESTKYNGKPRKYLLSKKWQIVLKKPQSATKNHYSTTIFSEAVPSEVVIFKK
jgi:hypothetical protein